MSEGLSGSSSHRRTGDVKLLASGGVRTPNGAADLLTNEANVTFDNSYPLDHHSSFTIDNGDEDELPHKDLDYAKIVRKSSQDPDGKNKRSSFVSLLERHESTGDESVCSARSQPGEGKAKLERLSNKTSKIMSEYQSYLSEIESDIDTEGNEVNGSGINSVREGVRDRYANQGTDSNTIKCGMPALRDEFYEAGREDTPLQFSLGGRFGTDTAYDFENQMLERGQKYVHPLSQSRRLQKTICGVLFTLAIVGLSVGISMKKHKDALKNLPDWEGQLANMEGEHMPKGHFSKFTDSDEADVIHIQAAMGKNKPLLYERSNGWTGTTYTEAVEFCGNKPGYELCDVLAVCPNGREGDPIFGTQDSFGYVPVIDRLNEWVQVGPELTCVEYSHIHAKTPEWGFAGDNDKWTTSVMCCLGDDLMNEVGYELTSEKYKPKEFDRPKGWEGQSYREATEFCEGMENYELCSYEALCPFGPNMDSIVGENTSIEHQWVAINNNFNDWVNLGIDNMCVAYSHDHASKPEWGVSGKGDESITGTTVCCLAQPEEPKTVQNDIYQIAQSTFTPALYTRQEGWSGKTYNEAATFCEGKGSYLCPYEAICPLGDDTEPITGYRGDREAWVPISDSDNDWVQVSRADAVCIQYSHSHTTGPNWGISGGDVLTDNLLCCKGTDLSPSAPSLTGSSKPENESISPYSDKDKTKYEEIANEFMPQWFDRSNGWKGQTYLEAFQFCGTHIEGHDLCPLEAICPLGEDSEPLGGYRDGPSFSWVPIIDEQNHWVQVSSNGPLKTCAQPSQYSYGKATSTPDRGLSGDEDEEITRHIACCLRGLSLADADKSSQNFSTTKSAPTTATAGSAPALESADINMAVSDADIEKYTEALDRHQPKWYDRDSGWKGQSYLEATEFCKRDKKDYELCAYDAICPLGIDSEPLGGYKKNQPSSYIPMSDEADYWVEIGYDADSPSCVPWDSVHPEPPQWSVSGEGNEEITRNIACCLAQGDKKPVATPEESTPEKQVVIDDHPASDAKLTALDSTSMRSFLVEQSGDEPLDLESSIKKELKPEWFSLNNGWSGGSYDDASNFCQNRNKSICPYDAYCPHGPGQPITEGFKAKGLQGIQWAPVLENYNQWIMVGQKHHKSSTTCFSHKDLDGNLPVWGTSSTEENEIKQFLLCCNVD